MNSTDIIHHIIDNELHFHFVKSSGHGGQNINKRKTKAQLFFNVQDSQYLDDDQKSRLIELAGHFVHHHEGILILTCQEERYQHENKKKVIHHFTQLLTEALVEPKERIATNIPVVQKNKRKEDKQHHSKKKSHRQNSSIELQ